MEEKFMFRQVAVLYYTGHIVYAIAIHTKVKLLIFWCSKTCSKFAVCLCPELFQLSLGSSSLQFEVWELDKQSVQRGVQVTIWYHNMVMKWFQLLHRLASKNSSVGLNDYQETVGWDIVNTKSR